MRWKPVPLPKSSSPLSSTTLTRTVPPSSRSKCKLPPSVWFPAVKSRYILFATVWRLLTMLVKMRSLVSANIWAMHCMSLYSFSAFLTGELFCLLYSSFRTFSNLSDQRFIFPIYFWISSFFSEIVFFAWLYPESVLRSSSGVVFPAPTNVISLSFCSTTFSCAAIWSSRSKMLFM